MMRMIDGEEPRFKDLDNRFMADCEESSQRYFLVSLLLPVSYHLSSYLYKSSCFFFLLAPSQKDNFVLPFQAYQRVRQTSQGFGEWK